MRRVMQLVIASVFLFVPVLVTASPLIKGHKKVKIGSEVIATYTYIISKGNSPQVAKWLYEDEEGRLLVVRSESSGTSGTSGTITISSVGANPETLTITLVANDSITFALGTQQFVVEYANSDFPPAAVTAGQAMVASASASFRDALSGLTKLGVEHSLDFHFVSALLGEVMFPSLGSELPSQDLSGEPESLYNDFDPTLHAPTTFEQQFGQAYFEL